MPETPTPPSPSTPTGGLLPFAADGPCSKAWWLAQIEAAKDKRKKMADQFGWKDRIESYLARTLPTAPKDDTIIVPKDFANVEQKKAQLFAQIPELHLEPKLDTYAPAAPIAQAVLRQYLGSQEINAEATMDEVLFDALCPAGLMISKIGYESVQDGTVPVDTGQVDALGQPVIAQAPNTIWERYFWERISPMKVLIPSEFHGSDYHKAPWLGFEFEFDETADTGLNAGETVTFEARTASPQKKTGVEIWYRPQACGDPTEKHPEKMRCLTFRNGEPVGHADSPYQRMQPDGTLLGVRRNPIRIAALRYVSDSAYPPSDCAMSTPQVEELSKGRTQMVQQRERNRPMRGYDRNRVAPEDIEKIRTGEYQALIPFDGNPAELIAEISPAQFPRENYEFDRIANRDLSEVWALSVTPGSEVDGPKTATEASLFQGRTDTRLRKERSKVLNYYVAAAEDILSLIQLFADDQDFVRVVGADGVAKLQAWDKTTIAGEFAFSAKPDSAVFQDQASQRQRAKETFQFLAPNPFVNQQQLVAWFLQQNDMEPTKFVAPPKDPEPDKPKVTFSFKGDDLNPMNPQFPIVTELMVQAGFAISPTAIQNAQARAAMAPPPTPDHGGAPIDHARTQHGTAPTQSPLNKHAADESGMTNSGLAPAVN